MLILVKFSKTNFCHKLASLTILMGVFRPTSAILLMLDPIAVLVVTTALRLLLLVVMMITSNHHVEASVRTLHLSILLQKSCILHLWVAVSELVLHLWLLMTVTDAALSQWILRVLLILDHRVDLVIFKLAVTRVVFRVRQRQNVATLIRVSDVDVLFDFIMVKVLIVVFLGFSDARVRYLATLRLIISRSCQVIGVVLERL